jgi:guanosine-3',5'-bis(diphosphate) 3'-pyrophosphohydrolase
MPTETYTNIMDRAILRAGELHKDQVDKGGVPIMHHLYRVATTAYAASHGNADVFCIGMLHDTLEDTDYTIEDLTNEFGATIAQGVILCTHWPGVAPYSNYILNIVFSKNLSAIEVKIMDLLDNTSPRRCATEAQRAVRQKNLPKYLRALQVLTSARARFLL